VATHGRLIDLIQKKHIKFDDISMTVLDEAVQMADIGFYRI
jgi:superfamily II DNA/RNA helicase